MGWFKSLGIALASSCAVYAVTVNNPIMYVDSPDPSIVRVDDAYYMVTTTMHFAPGVPVFKKEHGFGPVAHGGVCLPDAHQQ